MAERWDCIFVERIDPTGRIYLTNPQKYGCMYVTQARIPSEETRVRKSIPRECNQIKGSSNENKILIATAIAAALNHNDNKSFNGIVIRGFKGRTALPGLQTALIKTEGKTLREKGTTGWLIYISPNEIFYEIKGGFIGDKLSQEQVEKIKGCISYIENEWK